MRYINRHYTYLLTGLVHYVVSVSSLAFAGFIVSTCGGMAWLG